MRLGTALHLLAQDRLVLRAGGPLPPLKKLEALITQSIVMDEQMREQGSIQDIFGPVENPYVVVHLDEAPEDGTSLLGQTFYYLEQRGPKKHPRKTSAK
jgi:rRNA processing protein Gar1